jgi:hypothetical protein
MVNVAGYLASWHSFLCCAFGFREWNLPLWLRHKFHVWKFSGLFLKFRIFNFHPWDIHFTMVLRVSVAMHLGSQLIASFMHYFMLEWTQCWNVWWFVKLLYSFLGCKCSSQTDLNPHCQWHWNCLSAVFNIRAQCLKKIVINNVYSWYNKW